MAAGRVVAVDAGRISDWPSFHDVFAEAFGFPDWYGRNLDAWIDLFTGMDDEAPATGVAVAPGGTVTILLDNAAQFRERVPEAYAAFVECAAFVNWRRIEAGDPPYLILAFRA